MTAAAGQIQKQSGDVMKKTTFLALFLMLAAQSATGAATVQIEGVSFEKSVDIDDTRLQLQGTALLKYMVFIKAYVGALYTATPSTPEEILGPVPKQLVLEYFHAIKGADFADATRKKIEDNTAADQLAALQSRIDQLAVMYRDVQPGDRYALTYLPGVGTELALNGEPLGTIPGEDFARAVFSIWLGPNPIDGGFRDLLLGAK
jgi:hypothetical protein